jgi:parallel beta-helix repeat protein
MIIKNEIVGDYIGIIVYSSSNNKIIENDMTGNYLNIHLIQSFNNYIFNNSLLNSWISVSLFYLSYDNKIFGNNISSNGEGIVLDSGCFNNSMLGNRMKGNGNGIRLYYGSSYNSIVENKITNNNHGILFDSSSDNNRVSRNEIASNGYGIKFHKSSNNLIFHNSFINNTQQVQTEIFSYVNVWDDGYPSGGNYWSDYTGFDLYSGPYQNETGIGDTPYVIDENNVDYYPLMNPWTPKPSVINATVDIQPQALNLRSKGKWITAYIELPESYDVSNINVSTIMLNNTIPIDLEAPVEIGDYDNDTILDLMVKFNRTQFVEYMVSQGITFGNVTLTLTGELYNGTIFEGNAVLRVSSLFGDVNCDGKVNIVDLIQLAASYGSKEGEPKWNPNANFAPPYNRIDLIDLVTIAVYYGRTYP